MPWMERQRPRPRGSIFVSLERESFLPGEPIAGVILVHVDAPIADTRLVVELRGRETIQWTTHKTLKLAGGSKSYVCKFLSSTFVLRELVVISGTNAYPFLIRVPPGAPPSSNVSCRSSEQDFRAKLTVEYSVGCRLVGRDRKVPPLEVFESFTVRSVPLGIPRATPVEKSSGRKFRYHYLTKKGSCKLNVQLDSDVYTFDSVVTTLVWLELATPDKLRSIGLDLYRRLMPNPGTKLERHRGPIVQPVCTSTFERNELEDGLVFQLHLPIRTDSLFERDPCKPTRVFHHLRIAYEVVVTCHVESCRPIRVAIPVTMVEPRDCANGTRGHENPALDAAIAA